jgi:hypothetical protein
MISVGDFVKHSSVWRQITPTLEQFVRWVNINVKRIGREIKIYGPPDRNALIAEVAFRLAKVDFAAAPASKIEVETHARHLIEQLPRGEAAATKLLPYEWQHVYDLCNVIRSYIANFPSVQFSPRVPGCGVVDAATADLLADCQLIEVKAVKRQFRSADYRQVLTYAAMLYASGQAVDNVTLLNPRLGIVVSTPIDSVAAGVCGQSRVELMQDLVNCMISLQVSA